MAYQDKYKATFATKSGKTAYLYLAEDGYSGSVIEYQGVHIDLQYLPTSDAWTVYVNETGDDAELLPINEENSKYINYPTSYFIKNDDIVIVVYNVAIGSLYDVLKMYDKKLPIEFIKKIIFQLNMHPQIQTTKK